MSKVLGTLSRQTLEGAPNPRLAIFDRVADLIVEREYQTLTPRQRAVQLLLIYDNEVCNGGHLQFFHNQGSKRDQELLLALEAVGAVCQREAFALASRQASLNPVHPVGSLGEYHERAMEEEFWQYDKVYYACRPEIGRDLLPDYVFAHLEEFVQIE